VRRVLGGEGYLSAGVVEKVVDSACWFKVTRSTAAQKGSCAKGSSSSEGSARPPVVGVHVPREEERLQVVDHHRPHRWRPRQVRVLGLVVVPHHQPHALEPRRVPRAQQDPVAAELGALCRHALAPRVGLLLAAPRALEKVLPGRGGGGCAGAGGAAAGVVRLVGCC